MAIPVTWSSPSTSSNRGRAGPGAPPSRPSHRNLGVQPPSRLQHRNLGVQPPSHPPHRNLGVQPPSLGARSGGRLDGQINSLHVNSTFSLSASVFYNVLAKQRGKVSPSTSLLNSLSTRPEHSPAEPAAADASGTLSVLGKPGLRLPLHPRDPAVPSSAPDSRRESVGSIHSGAPDCLVAKTCSPRLLRTFGYKASLGTCPRLPSALPST